MTDMITKSLNKLYLVLSIIVLTGLMSVSSVAMADAESRGVSNRTVSGLAIGIGTACAEALAGIARQPEAEVKILAAYTAGADAIKALEGRVSSGEIGEAIGLLKAAEAEGVARQPEAADKLATLAAVCIEDLNSLR